MMDKDYAELDNGMSEEFDLKIILLFQTFQTFFYFT